MAQHGSEDAIFTYLRQLKSTSFYGDVILHFKAGEVVLLNVDQTIKPTDLAVRDGNRTEGEPIYVRTERTNQQR